MKRLRKFSGSSLGNIHFVDKLILELDGKRAWFFHGDVFDISIQNVRWIAKLGRYGYNLLIFLNRSFNWTLAGLGREKYSLSKRIKGNVKGAIRFIQNFERTVQELAIDKTMTMSSVDTYINPRKKFMKMNTANAPI